MIAKELLYNILKFSSDNKFPDIHINTKHFPIYRNHNGEIEKLESLEIN
jgi:Tfp pilus assembly pilus retraction ATPase PilT